MEKIWDIRGLDCANCAAKLERAIGKVDGVRNANLNFMAQKLVLDLAEHNQDEILESVRKVIKVVEPGVTVRERATRASAESHKHFRIERKQTTAFGHEHEACGCGHEHAHEQDPVCNAELLESMDHVCVLGHDNENREKHAHNRGEDCSCGCAHDHENEKSAHHAHDHDHAFSIREEPHEEARSRFGAFRFIYAQIAFAGVLLILSLFLGQEKVFALNNPKMWLCLAAYLAIGGEVVWNSMRSISRGKIFDENFLMMIASVGAFAIGDFPEAVGVMLFYRVGEMFQDFAVERSRKNIKSLLDLRPDFAFVKRGDEIFKVSPDEVEIGEIIAVKAGERIPLDGVLVSGRTTVDNSALTGESLPKELSAGDEVLSGCINLSGTIEIRTTKEFAESTVSKILDLVENATAKKSRSENFITKFAKYYTPAVVMAAVLLAFVPCIFLGFGAISEWGYRALTFLVISCPCALVISVPMSFFGGIGGASKLGVLIKGSHNVEELARTEIVVFDKTGTLTKGSFSVTEIDPAGTDEEELLRICAVTESVSNHPIAKSIAAAFGKPIDASGLTDAQERSGFGIEALLDGERVLCGNGKLMESESIEYIPVERPGTVVYAAKNGAFLGSLLISDEVKPDSREAISALKAAGVKETVMLTGDNRKAAQLVADELGLDRVCAELLPQDKVEQVEKLLSQKSGQGKLLFVGDGINDAPVIARADVGVAMGGLGSDAAIEVADVVLMTDEPSKIAAAVEQSRRTMRIVKQNIIFALGVKAVILVLGALGFASMWLAVFADVGVSFLAILNALRALRVRRKKSK